VPTNIDPGQLIGRILIGPDGEKIGEIGQLYLDDRTGAPAFATVRTGLFGSRQSLVPLSQVDFAGEDVHVPYGKDMIKGAPNVDAADHLSPDEEARLYGYYNLPYTDDAAAVGKGGAPDYPSSQAAQVDHGDRSGQLTEDARATDDAMTRSEQRLRIETERAERGRARLRKYVTTEPVQETVPVTREQVRVEREPITDENVEQAMRGPDISEAEHEVTVTEERPVVEKETVPVERVRLAKDAVTDEAQVTDDVAKEQIETDGVDEGAGGRGRRRDR